MSRPGIRPGAVTTALLALAATLAGAPHVSAQGAPAAIARFERALAADVAADSVGAIAAAVVMDGETVWRGAFGWADRDRRTLATPATIFRVGSISKTITAAAMMRLVERGVVDLDAPVRDAVPELRRLANLPADAPPITYRQLAAHTAGLAREPGASHAARGSFRRWKRKLVAAIPSTAVLDPPGARYRYSNIGYGILGFALERAAGEPYERLVQELVLDPLAMTSTFLVVPDRERRRLATGYVNPAADSVDPRVPRAEHRGRGYKVPNGGVYSTVDDLARLLVALSDPAAADAAPAPFLPEPLRRRMLVDQTPAPRPDPDSRSDRAHRADRDAGDAAADRAGYGLGLQLQRIGDATLAGHSGAVAGYTAYLLFDPATATGVVLLRNYNRGSTNLGAAAGRLLLDLGAAR